MSADPFQDLLDLAKTIRNEVFQLHSRWAFIKSLSASGMTTTNSTGMTGGEFCQLPPLPARAQSARDRAEKLQKCLDEALIAAAGTGFSVDEVSRRINTLADPLRHLIFWEQNWKEGAPPSFVPKRGWLPPPVPVTFIIGDYTRAPGGPYLLYHDHELMAAWPSVRELAICIAARCQLGERADGAGADHDAADGESAPAILRTRGREQHFDPQKDQEIAEAWQRAHGSGVAKKAFVKDLKPKLSLVEFDNLLARVRKRKKARTKSCG